MIDIGGPSMLRAAAKNFAHVAPVCQPERYGAILAELRESEAIALETRRALAAEAFSVTAAYEAAIARWFSDRDAFPELLIPSFEKVTDLVYGENPHQRAAYYAEVGARRHLLSRSSSCTGASSRSSTSTTSTRAGMLLREFELPACVIVKHANPCGVAVAGSIEEAYDRALASDPLSAFGMVCVLNRPVGAELGVQLAEQFVDVLLAPDYDEAALEALRAEAEHADPRRPRAAALRPRREGLQARATAACSSRTATGTFRPARRMEVVSRLAVGGRLGRPALRLAGLQARLVERDRDREGPADARHRSRADEPRRRGPDRRREGARRTATTSPGRCSPPTRSSPSPTARGLALDAGVKAIIQPGGSKRDQEVIDAVEQAGATMVFTHRRHFRH